MSAANRRPAPHGLLPRVTSIAMVLCLIAGLTGCALLGRPVGTSLATVNLNQEGRRDLPFHTWTGVYAGEDIAGLTELIGGDDELVRVGAMLAATDPARSFVVVRVLNTCSREDVHLRRHGARVELSWTAIQRECYVAAMRLFAWSIDYADVGEEVTVDLCGRAWSVQQHAAAPTGASRCGGR